MVKTTKILVVATRDPRGRYRFISQPLKMLPDIDCVEIAVQGRSLTYLFENFKQAWKNRDAGLVIFVGGNLTAILWFILAKIIIRKKFVLRIGGDLVAPLISFLKNGRYNSRKEYLLYCVNIVVNIIALNIADGIIIVHNQLKEEISKYTLRKVKVQVAPQFIEREQDTLPRARLGSSKTINLLTVTNLAFPEKYHGLLFFLNALSRFARDGSEEVKINFDILGDGFYLSKLNDDIKKYCTDRFTVKAHGFVKDVRLFYESADIFLYCSTFDGLPNVLLEAMYFGLPIMVNSYPNFKDILKNGENALFFDIENYDQFVSDLNQLINDQNIYESMSSNNINKSREDYSCLAVAKKLQKIVSLYTSIQ